MERARGFTYVQGSGDESVIQLVHLLYVLTQIFPTATRRGHGSVRPECT